MIRRSEYTLTPRPPETIPAPDFETLVTTQKTSDGLQFDIAITQNETDPTAPDIIMTQPWSGSASRADVRGGQVPIAAIGLGARAISIDNLGIGKGTSKIPRAMHQDLRNGNFDPMTALQWEAITEAVPDLHENIIYFGYSQGAPISAWLAKNTPEGHTTQDIMLLESVGLQPQAFAALVARYGCESAKWYTGYLTAKQVEAHTPPWMPKPGSETSIPRSPLDLSGLYDYPRGLARTRMLGALATAYENGAVTPDTHIAIVNNAHSGISTNKENDRFAHQLAWTGGENIQRITVNGHSHGMIDDATAMLAFFEQYARNNPL